MVLAKCAIIFYCISIKSSFSHKEDIKVQRNNIYYRKDGRWEGRIPRGKRKNGRRKFQYVFGKSKDEVRDKMDAIKNRELQHGYCTLNVSQLFSEWYQSIQHRVKESTAANYRMKAKKHILPVFGEKQVESVLSTDVYAFIELEQQKGLSNRYVADIIILMKSIFKYAARTYHITNPMDSVMLPRKKLPEIKLLDEMQLIKLQEYISENQNRTTLGIALSMSTGVRIGELCALQWKDINLEKRILTVRKTIQRIQCAMSDSKTKLVITEPKSESSRRCIPIPDCIMDLLRTFQGKSDEFVLAGTKKPIEPRTLQYRFAKVLKNVKLPSVHFHALRHIFASTCIKLGFDVKTLSELLGHSSVEITLNRYVHSSFDQKREYMERLKLAF